MTPSIGTAIFGGDVSLAENLALLLALSFFIGLAYEDINLHAGTSRPGGVRTFPVLGLLGAALFLLDPNHLIPFTAGLAVVGAWLLLYYREHLQERDERGRQNVGMVIVLVNFYAYVLGPMTVALPHWAAVGATVTVVLLFASRETLHQFAQRIDTREFFTAAQFLILVGLILPLLPAEPVTTLTQITPRQAWFALVVVCGLSYASYLVQRYLAPTGTYLWTAALGGLYSSTATTVVLSRQAKAQPAMVGQAQAGITLATAIMYVRILAIVAVFNLTLARSLAPWFVGLSVLALAIAAFQYRLGSRAHGEAPAAPSNRNPLELGAAVTFAVAFIVISLLSAWVKGAFGTSGLYWLAAVVGVSDIDPFVLNLAQGGAAGLSGTAVTAAILIATSSNNLLKATYSAMFTGWKASIPSVVALVVLAIAGLSIALTIGLHS